MSAGPDQDIASAWRPDVLTARLARAGERAEAALTGAIADFLVPDDARLDDRTRAAMSVTLRGIVERIASDIRRHAARLLADRDRSDLVRTVMAKPADIIARLTRTGALHYPALVTEMVARVRLDHMQATLPLAIGRPEEPSLMVRLAAAPDHVVASAGAALLAAENRRRGPDANSGMEIDLPADLHRRLTWSIAAAIGAAGGHVEIEQAVIEATLRMLGSYDESERLDAMATRLVKAIEPRRAELPELLVDALGDGRLRLFVALLAHALELPPEQARAITLERSGDRLWPALRALDLDRATIARIAFALAEADPMRDIEAFADELGAIATIDPADARAALAPLWHPADYRAAVLTQAGAP